MYRRKPDCSFSLNEVAECIGAELRTAPGIATPILGICSLEAPVRAHLAFLRAIPTSSNFRLPASDMIGAVIVPTSFQSPEGVTVPPLLLHENPLFGFLKAVQLFYEPESWNEGTHPTAEIHPSVTFGPRLSVAAFSVIGPGCKLGKNVTIHPHVTIYPRVTIGDDVVIHAGAIIREDVVIGNGVVIQAGAVVGSDGFGYVWDGAEGHVPVPQLGNVVLEDRVRVGVNASVDRATLQETRIGWGTKVDNLVQIGHNCIIGKHALLCGQSGVAGSSRLGDGVVLGGQSGVADHVDIPAGSRIAAGSAVMGTLKEKDDYGGIPAVPMRNWRRQVVAMAKLPRLLRGLTGKE